LQSRGGIRVLYLGVALAVVVVTAVASLGVKQLRQIAQARIAMTTQNMALTLDRNTESTIDVIDLALQVRADEGARQLATSTRSPLPAW
jgi:hypothetical protein